MRVCQFQKCHKSGSKFLMITLVFYFLFYVSITPLVFGLEEEIKVELELNESFEDTHEFTEEFLKELNSDYNSYGGSLTTIEELNEKFLSSFKPDIPLPPPKSN